MVSDSNGIRILKGTLYLYFRMIFLTLISVYTVRIVLHTLGVSDYGIYNVVGGFIGLLGFFSSTITSAAQRFYSICLTKHCREKLTQIFSCNLLINIFFAILAFLIAEFGGRWFILNELQIPADRIGAAIIVFELSVVTFIAGLMQSSFLGILVAEENFAIYSYVSIIEGLSKLGIAYLLTTINSDRLILYAVLLCVVAISIDIIYIVYCVRRYDYVRFELCRDWQVYKNIFFFTNWTTIGAVAAVLKDQGLNIIINIFFGPVINAARAIAFQINGVISSFAQNFMNAVNPQIIKSYANREQDKFVMLINSSSKIAYYLLLIVTMPIIMNVEYILHLWLIQVPEYAGEFVSLVLIDALIGSITSPFATAVQAIGRIKWYQLTVGGVALLNLPISFMWLQYTANPLIPFYVSIFITGMMGALRLINFYGLYNFSISSFLKNLIFRAAIVTATIMWIDWLCFAEAQNFIVLIRNCVGSIFISVIMIYLLGLTYQEKCNINKMLSSRWRRNP